MPPVTCLAAVVFWDLVASLKEVCKEGRTDEGGLVPSTCYGIIAALSSTVAAFLQFRAILMGYVLAEELEHILWPHSQKIQQPHQPHRLSGRLHLSHHCL